MAKCRFFYRSDKSKDIFHEENEDYMMHSRISLMNDVSVDVMAVADGMGGMDNGKTASKEAVAGFMSAFYDEIMKCYVPQRRNFTITHYCGMLKEVMVKAFQAANRRVCETEEPGTHTGTTLSAAVLAGSYLLVGNVGDSPVYFYCAQTEEMELVSTLQTKAEQDFRAGRYDRFSEPYYDNDYILIHYMGEYEELPENVICFHTTELVESGDMILLCSDGAAGQCTPEEISRILLDNEERRALRCLFEKAAEDKADDQTAIWARII